MANAQVQVHLKNSQTVITAKAFDKRSNDQVVALVGMDDEIIAVVKDVPGWHGSATPRPTRSCQAYRMP